MAYTVLARRYRSSTFDEIIGQEHIAQTLKKAIETGRIAHAYLFCGTRGTGKTSTARILAKCLNCLKSEKPTATPCGECDSCLSIARGEDIDVIEIDAASNTGVDNVRDLISNSQFRPARARFRAYIIDEVHMLSKSAFNALLKTLEEPPSHVKFILATTEPEKVLATILSRCQRYDFRNIPTREIAAHLLGVCKSEKIKADPDALLLVAKAGAGSMRDSLSLLERLLSIGESHLTAQTVEQLLGLPRSQVLMELAQAIGEGDVKRTLSQAEAILMAGMSADTLIATLADHLRNLLVLRTCGPDSGLVEVPGVNPKDLQKQAERFDAIVLTQDITILEELRRHMRQSQTGRALMDATLVRLALAEQFASIGELLARVVDAGAGVGEAQKKNAREGGSGEESVGSGFSRPEEEHGEDSTPAAAMPETTVAAAAARKFTIAPEPELAPPTPIPAAPASSETAESSPSRFDDDDDLPRPGKVWDSSGPSLSELLRQQANSTTPTAPAAKRSDPSAKSSESSVVPLNDGDVARIWPVLLAQLDREGTALAGVLKLARLESIVDGQAVIRFAREAGTFAKRMATNGKRDMMARILTTLVGREVGVRFEVEAPPSDAPAAPPPAAPLLDAPATLASKPLSVAASGATHAADRGPDFAPRDPPPALKLTPELTAAIEQDPLVRAVMQELGGKIVKVE